MEFTTIAGRECFVFLPNNYDNEETSYPVVYLHGDKSTYALLKEADFLSDLSYIIIGIMSKKRLDELTPWPSPSLNPKFPGFGGEGNAYIQFIETKLKPEVDLTYRTLASSQSTGITGYSLGGLISIYAAFHTTSFGCFASMSGSFWYPEFVPCVTKQSVRNREARFYMSSGDSEGVGHKDRKKDAVTYTKKVYELLVSDVTSSRVTINWDEGGHHANTHKRYKDALLWFNHNLKNN
ncbi:MAG: alpha/beta hydrolase [Clostridiales bacterium]|nr:alpha/beta hydrolase [Clostridiales bacterium]